MQAKQGKLGIVQQDGNFGKAIHRDPREVEHTDKGLVKKVSEETQRHSFVGEGKEINQNLCKKSFFEPLLFVLSTS